MVSISPITSNRIPIAFRGAAGSDTKADEKTYADKVNETVDGVKQTTQAVADGAKDIAGTTVAAVGTVGGTATLVKNEMKKTMDPETRGFFKKVGMWFTKEIEGAKTIIKDGKEITPRTADWKHIGIAGGIVAGVVAGISIYKGVKAHMAAKAIAAKEAAAEKALAAKGAAAIQAAETEARIAEAKAQTARAEAAAAEPKTEVVAKPRDAEKPEAAKPKTAPTAVDEAEEDFESEETEE